MPRVRKGAARNKARRRILRKARGYFGTKSRHKQQAKVALLRAGQFAYRDRRNRKRDFRRLWITRITAACRMRGTRYSRFIHGLEQAGVLSEPQDAQPDRNRRSRDLRRTGQGRCAAREEPGRSLTDEPTLRKPRRPSLDVAAFVLVGVSTGDGLFRISRAARAPSWAGCSPWRVPESRPGRESEHGSCSRFQPRSPHHGSRFQQPRCSRVRSKDC